MKRSSNPDQVCLSRARTTAFLLCISTHSSHYAYDVNKSRWRSWHKPKYVCLFFLQKCYLTWIFSAVNQKNTYKSGFVPVLPIWSLYTKQTLQNSYTFQSSKRSDANRTVVNHKCAASVWHEDCWQSPVSVKKTQQFVKTHSSRWRMFTVFNAQFELHF